MSCSPPSPRLPAEVAVLLIEHDMDLVFRFADRISVLVDGALFVDGAPEDVARDPRVKAVYLGEDGGYSRYRRSRDPRLFDNPALHFFRPSLVALAFRRGGGQFGNGSGAWTSPTVYQVFFSAARSGLKVVPDLSMAQATLRRRSATERRARP